MKKCIAILTFFLLSTSCTVSKKAIKYSDESHTIVYLMPNNIEELLKMAMAKRQENIYFELWSNDSVYRICINQLDEKLHNPWIQNSNRKLFINGKFFPLVFDLDRTFAITDNGDELLKKLAKEKYPLLNRKLSINEGVYYIKFKKVSNEVIESGYDGLK